MCSTDTLYPFGTLEWLEMPRQDGDGTYFCRMRLGMQGYNDDVTHVVTFDSNGFVEAWWGSRRLLEEELSWHPAVLHGLKETARETSLVWMAAWPVDSNSLIIRISGFPTDEISKAKLNRVLRQYIESKL